MLFFFSIFFRITRKIVRIYLNPQGGRFFFISFSLIPLLPTITLIGVTELGLFQFLFKILESAGTAIRNYCLVKETVIRMGADVADGIAKVESSGKTFLPEKPLIIVDSENDIAQYWHDGGLHRCKGCLDGEQYIDTYEDGTTNKVNETFAPYNKVFTYEDLLAKRPDLAGKVITTLTEYAKSTNTDMIDVKDICLFRFFSSSHLQPVYAILQSDGGLQTFARNQIQNLSMPILMKLEWDVDRAISYFHMNIICVGREILPLHVAIQILHITQQTMSPYMRSMLVQGAHYYLGQRHPHEYHELARLVPVHLIDLQNPDVLSLYAQAVIRVLDLPFEFDQMFSGQLSQNPDFQFLFDKSRYAYLQDPERNKEMMKMVFGDDNS